MSAAAWYEVFRVAERPPPCVHTLHGPMRRGVGCWPDPYAHPWGRDDFEAEARRPVVGPATERWEHGLLVEVESADRLAELRSAWGSERTARARLGDVALADVEAVDRHRIRAFCSRGWMRPLVRAFRHAGCKAARVGRLDAAGLAAFGDLGAALLAARARSRIAVLEELLAARDGAHHSLFAELDIMDRALDGEDGGPGDRRPWVMQRVPEHTLNLWPVRNLLRLVERQGVIFRAMSFREYDAQVAYAPELPVLCLDPEIYGGGFDHDLFHRLVPVLVGDDPLAYEVGLLAIEAAAQAFNSLVLSAWYRGPAYEGHATWLGAALFEQLERAFGVPSVAQQIVCFRIVGLVCHPDFDRDPIESWLELVPPGADRWTVESLVARYRRYVVRDAHWLRGLRPRYATPVFRKWRPSMDDRLTDSLEHALGALDGILADVEDVDLRVWGLPLLGQVAEGLQVNRRTLLKTLELDHLLEVAGAAAAPVRPPLDAVLVTTRDLHRRWHALRHACERLASVAPEARDGDAVLALDAQRAELDALGEARDAALQVLVTRVREQQRRGVLPGPEVPADFAGSYVELFDRIYYDPPIHVGADLPGVL